jgi:histone-lysine N-methyltransferase SETMAR
MAAYLQLCTKQEMQSMIRFLDAQGAKPMEIYTRMLAKYGASCMSKTQVYEWVQKFKNRVQSVEDSPRPGQAHRGITPEMIAAVDYLTRENRCITISDIATEMKISVGSAHTIVVEELHYRKICARWFPRHLTPEIKERRWDVCSVLFAWYEQKGETFFKRIIIGDESYMHFFTPESKHTNSQWRHQSSPRPKKVRSQASAGKVLLTAFWDHKRVILEHYLEQRETINMKGTVICFRIGLSQQFEQNTMVFVFWRVYAA